MTVSMIFKQVGEFAGEIEMIVQVNKMLNEKIRRRKASFFEISRTSLYENAGGKKKKKKL